MIYYIASESYQDYWDGHDETYVTSAETLPESTCKKWTRIQRYMGAEMEFQYSQTNIYYEITKEEHDIAQAAQNNFPEIDWDTATREEGFAFHKAVNAIEKSIDDLFSKYAEISLRSKI